jgi:hypothetical protein
LCGSWPRWALPSPPSGCTNSTNFLVSAGFATNVFVRRLQLPCLLAALTGCGEAPAVEVSTYVGEATPSEDLEASWADAAEVFAAATTNWRPAPRLESDAAARVTHPPGNKDEFHLLVRELRRGPLDEMAGPASRIAAATPAVWPVIKASMLAERKAPKGDYRSLLAAIGGDVPNRYGTFKLAWKKAHGYRVKLSVDWFGDLLALPRSKVSGGLRKVYRDCVLQAALVRAAANIARLDPTMASDVVASLLDTAYLHRGTFRDEVGRAMRSIGDPAVPHLVLASVLPANARRDMTATPVRKAEYARLQTFIQSNATWNHESYVSSIREIQEHHPSRAFFSHDATVWESSGSQGKLRLTDPQNIPGK